jgi:hypothetical protein
MELSRGEPPADHGSEQATVALPEASRPPSTLRVILRQDRYRATGLPATPFCAAWPGWASGAAT